MLNFIFDLDDTLIETNKLFLEAEQSFFYELEKLGFDRSAAEKIFVELDTRNIERFGFMPKRFYSTMGETYETMCRLSGKRNSQVIRKRLEDIGRRIFRLKYRVLDGVFPVLEMLTQNGDKLLLWTRGDIKVQKRKLSSTGLDKYFSNVYILNNKTKSELTEIIMANKLSLSATWVVGDSIKVDINPALEAGANAIWIPIDSSWRYEAAQPIRNDFIRLANISELAKVHPELQSH